MHALAKGGLDPANRFPPRILFDRYRLTWGYTANRAGKGKIKTTLADMVGRHGADLEKLSVSNERRHDFLFSFSSPPPNHPSLVFSAPSYVAFTHTLLLLSSQTLIHPSFVGAKTDANRKEKRRIDSYMLDIFSSLHRT
jgi:hypothetical protein